MPENSPERLTDGSIPAKAANLAAERNLDISPISLKIAAPRTGPTPGTVVIGVSNLENRAAIFSSNSMICCWEKRICSMYCLISPLIASLPSKTPKDFLATERICSAFCRPNRLWLGTEMSSISFSVSTASISAGVGQVHKSAEEVNPKISVNSVSCSGKTWSSSAITLRLRSDVMSTIKNRARHISRSAYMSAGGILPWEYRPKRITSAMIKQSLSSVLVWRMYISRSALDWMGLNIWTV